MADLSEKTMKKIWLLQNALIEHLMETGIIDTEEFKHSVAKWRQKMGLEEGEDPLGFLSSKVMPVMEEAPAGEKSAAATTILLVDNVKFIRDLIKSTLASYGYHKFVEGENGYEAVELFNKHKPDLVMMDVEMKGMNGLEALREIRKTNKKTPVIIMTGNPTQDYVKMAVEFGMTDFVAKPLDVNRVLGVIQKLLGH